MCKKLYSFSFFKQFKNKKITTKKKEKAEWSKKGSNSGRKDRAAALIRPLESTVRRLRKTGSSALAFPPTVTSD